MRINKAIKISFHGRHKGKAKFIVAYDGSQPSFSLSLSLSLSLSIAIKSLASSDDSFV